MVFVVLEPVPGRLKQHISPLVFGRAYGKSLGHSPVVSWGLRLDGQDDADLLFLPPVAPPDPNVNGLGGGLTTGRLLGPAAMEAELLFEETDAPLVEGRVDTPLVEGPLL